MTTPDLNATVDRLWPRIRSARNKGWRAIGGVAGVSFVVLYLMGSLWGELIFFLIFLAILCMVGACIYGIHKIKEATAPIDAMLSGIAGLTQFSHSIAAKKHVPREIIPVADRETVRDCLSAVVSQYTVVRTEYLSVSTDSDGRSKHPVFRGYVLSVNGLDASQTLLLVARSAGRNARQLRRFTRAHADPSMRHEERVRTEDGSDISIFGDGAWNQPDEMSPAAQICIDTFQELNTLMAADETLLAAYFGTTRSAVSIKTKKSRARIGGLLVTKASLTTNIDASLKRLLRAYQLAGVLIALSNPTVPDGS